MLEQEPSAADLAEAANHFGEYVPTDDEMEQAAMAYDAMARRELARSRDMMADDPFYGLTLDSTGEPWGNGQLTLTKVTFVEGK